MRRLLVAVVLLALFGAACNRTPASTTSQDTTPTSTAISEPSTAKDDCETSNGGVDGTLMYLTDVRTGTHDTYDRVTFEFSKGDGPVGVPKFEISRGEPPLRYDGSGDPMEVDGESFAQIIFHGGTGVKFEGETPKQTWEGQKEMKPGYPALVELEQAGDFEATLSWVAGLSYRSCWTATEMENPVRLVWDFPHKH